MQLAPKRWWWIKMTDRLLLVAGLSALSQDERDKVFASAVSKLQAERRDDTKSPKYDIDMYISVLEDMNRIKLESER
jgi:hypothetical protein